MDHQPSGSLQPQRTRGIGIPAILIVSPDGVIDYRYRGRDFTDRPDDQDVFEAVKALGLSPLDRPPDQWSPGVDPEEDRGAFGTQYFGTYMSAVMLATGALAGRMSDETDRAEAAKTSAMAGSFLAAWRERREIAEG